MGKISMQQNSDMRRISAGAALIAVPTMIVGIYGMNFDSMPELHWRYGYIFFWGLCLATVTAMLLFFKRKKWL